MKIQTMKINWKNWRRKTWEFVKRFPAVSYGLASFMIAVIIAGIEYLNFSSYFVAVLAVPFIPIILAYAGISNIVRSTISPFANELITFVFFSFALLLLDLISIFLQKFFTKCLGENFFSKIIAIAVILFLWFCVFASLLESLPIDV